MSTRRKRLNDPPKAAEPARPPAPAAKPSPAASPATPPRRPASGGGLPYREDFRCKEKLALARLREIEEMFASGAAAQGTFKWQELAAERRELILIRDGMEWAISISLSAKDDPARSKALDLEVAAHMETRMAFIRRLEAEGEWRQARIHRMALLDIRHELRQQYFRG